MHTLHFLTKKNCPLCDRLKELMKPVLNSRSELHVIDIDIEGDPDLLDRFKHRVPVVLAGDRVLFEGRPSEEEVQSALKSNLAS